MPCCSRRRAMATSVAVGSTGEPCVAEVERRSTSSEAHRKDVLLVPWHRSRICAIQRRSRRGRLARHVKEKASLPFSTSHRGREARQSAARYQIAGTLRWCHQAPGISQAAKSGREDASEGVPPSTPGRALCSDLSSPLAERISTQTHIQRLRSTRSHRNRSCFLLRDFRYSAQERLRWRPLRRRSRSRSR